MPHTQPRRSPAAGPDRHDWWTVRFTWPHPCGDGQPSFTYAMRPNHGAVVNCATVMLIRGRKRGMTSERPLNAHVKGPHEDQWHAVARPRQQGADDDRQSHIQGGTQGQAASRAPECAEGPAPSQPTPEICLNAVGTISGPPRRRR